MATSFKSLKRAKHWLSSPQEQIKILSDYKALNVPSFQENIAKADMPILRPIGIDVFQVNVGKMCNQVCKHCHVDAGPDRKEIMTKQTMMQILEAILQRIILQEFYSFHMVLKRILIQVILLTLIKP